MKRVRSTMEINQRVRASVCLKNISFAHRGKRKKMLTDKKCCDSILGIGGHLFAKLRFYEKIYGKTSSVVL